MQFEALTGYTSCLAIAVFLLNTHVGAFMYVYKTGSGCFGSDGQGPEGGVAKNVFAEGSNTLWKGTYEQDDRRQLSHPGRACRWTSNRICQFKVL